MRETNPKYSHIDQSIDHVKFGIFCQWLHDNTGRRFKMVEDGLFVTYKDHNGKTKKMTAVNYQSRIVFMEYCQFYMNLYGHGDNPIIEFSDDYSQLKIYLKGKNFYL